VSVGVSIYTRMHVYFNYLVTHSPTQAGMKTDHTGAVVPPLYLSTTFARDENMELNGCVYIHISVCVCVCVYVCVRVCVCV
jgi:hypothetical protein